MKMIFPLTLMLLATFIAIGNINGWNVHDVVIAYWVINAFKCLNEVRRDI